MQCKRSTIHFYYCEKLSQFSHQTLKIGNDMTSFILNNNTTSMQVNEPKKTFRLENATFFPQPAL